ncbi:MAG: hypothetical protein ACXAEU_21320 [Candidatus Hodarchaeales archaeon]|jgi:hypothetical protein
MSTETPNFMYFQLGALAFGITPLAGLILNVFEQVFLALVISQLGILFFVFGVYSFSSISIDIIASQGKKIVAYFLLFWILYNVNIIFDNLFLINVSESLTVEEIRNNTSLAMLSGMLTLIHYTIFLYAALKFTKWFEQVTVEINTSSTTFMKWLGVTYLGAAILVFLGMTMLISLTLTGSLQDSSYVIIVGLGGIALAGIGRLIILGGFSLQVVTGLIIYSKLNNAKN